MQMVPINYWAILVCGIASMVLGSLWFGPLFGKPWQKLMGWENVDAAKKEEMMKGMTKSYVFAFVGALVMAYALAHSLVFAQAYLKVSGSSAALQGAFWTWLGFIAPVTMSSILWEGKSWKLWTLTNAYYLIQLLIFAFILVSWKV
jgi:hypothetical protein